MGRNHRIWAVIAMCFTATFAHAQRSTPIQLQHPAGAAVDQYGSSVAIDGDTMIIGASGDDVGSNVDQGSAHVYRWTGSGWTYEATLVANDGAVNDYFGYAVAISGDTVTVGAYGDDGTSVSDQGSAYVFTRSGATWSLQAKLSAPDGDGGDFFGYSVATSGDTVLVGAPFHDVGTSFGQGAAYMYVRTPGSTLWTLQEKLTSSDGELFDGFGYSVALEGDTAMIGAHLDNIGAIANQGSVYAFARSGATWSQQTQLVASVGAANDNFGYSVALSGDTVVVGAYRADVGGNTDQGSAYVFKRAGATWTQQAQLTASDGSADDQFGYVVALSGDTAIVGAYHDDIGANSRQGSATVFTRSGNIWSRQTQFTAPGGAANDTFGNSVAIFGDTAIVGAYFDDIGANNNQGSAWVFSRVGSTWIGPDLTLLASNGAASDQLGISVAISGDTAIVGAFSDDVGANANQGSAYIFVRTGAGTWTQQAQLFATGGAANDLFGFAVAISGDTALVGAYFDAVGGNTDQGSAYVFTRSGTTWTQRAQLNATGGTANDWFGYSVALAGDTAIIGAPTDDIGGNVNQGAAYVFTRSGTTWTQQAQLTALSGAATDQFGAAVAISGHTVIVGSNFDDVGANADQGSATVFTRSGTTWTQQAQLTATGGSANDQFGISAALSGDTAIVGASLDDVGGNADQGSAAVFTRSGTVWTQQAQLTAAGGAPNDQFGRAVALAGNTAIVGAYFDDVGALVDQGSAYVYLRSGTAWSQNVQISDVGGAAGDRFGYAVAVSGDTLIVGAPQDDNAAVTNQGSASFFDIPAGDFGLAHNDVTDVSYSTLAAALSPAGSGQQLTASEAAWRSIVTLNTTLRSLILRSGGDLRTPSTSTITLSGSSSLHVDPGNTIAIFGQLTAATRNDLTADSFLLGSRGTLTVLNSVSLIINAPMSSLQGSTSIQSGASLTFAGGVETIGPVTAGINSAITADGQFTNIDAFEVTDGTINTPMFLNKASANIYGASAVLDAYTNDAGAITTIRSGTLFVFGDFANDGRITGSTCLGGPCTSPGLDVGGDLTGGSTSTLALPFLGSLIRVGGDMDCAIDSNTRFNLRDATLQLEGGGAEQTLEAMSKDIGADVAGLDRTLPGHYPMNTLRIGAAASFVRVVDNHDNDGLGQSGCEAIYVDTLQIDAGSRLINTSCRVYYNTLINNGTIDVPANVIQLGGGCPADFNDDGFLDFTDFDEFVLAFEAGSSSSDFNGDGFLDFTDFDAFVAAFEAGC